MKPHPFRSKYSRFPIPTPPARAQVWAAHKVQLVRGPHTLCASGAGGGVRVRWAGRGAAPPDRRGRAGARGGVVLDRAEGALDGVGDLVGALERADHAPIASPIAAKSGLTSWVPLTRPGYHPPGAPGSCRTGRCPSRRSAGRAVLACGGQLVAVHHELPVAGDRHDEPWGGAGRRPARRGCCIPSSRCGARAAPGSSGSAGSAAARRSGCPRRR